MSRYVLVLSCALSLLASRAADAKPLRPLGAGVGVDMTYLQASGREDAERQFISPALDFQVDFLWALAVELSYKPNALKPKSEDELTLDAQFRLAGKIYIVPTDVAGVYVEAGIGAMSFDTLAKLDLERTTYQGGAGLEFYLPLGFSLGVEVLFLLPSVHEVESMNRARATARGDATRPEKGVAPVELVNARNFEAKAGVRWYF